MIYEAYKNIDRDRLEDVNLQTAYPIGQGRTFMFAMQLLGEAWLGDPGNEYLYIGERTHFAKDILRDFAQILQDEGFEVEVNMAQGKINVLSPKPCVFRFIGPERHGIERATRGIRWADVFVDLTYESADKIQRELDILLHTMEVYHAGSSTH